MFTNHLNPRYDISTLRNRYLGQEDTLLNVLQNNFGVTLTWEDLNRSIISASCDDQVLLANFGIEISGLCKNPSKLVYPRPIQFAQKPVHNKIVVDITSQADYLCANNYNILRWIEREYCITLRVASTSQDANIYLEAQAEDPQMLELYCRYIDNLFSDPISFRNEIELKFAKKVHIFVDVSNILIGAQQLPNQQRDNQVTLNIPHLVDLITNLRNAVQKVAVGSIPPRDHPFWEEWRQKGFTTEVFQRVPGGDGRTSEQAVDDVLHAQMLNTISRSYTDSRTLILLSGDGNRNNERTTFPDVLQSAMLHGWDVEVWSWSMATSNIYQEFSKNYPGSFSLKKLDEHRDYITIGNSTRNMVVTTASASTSNYYNSNNKFPPGGAINPNYNNHNHNGNGGRHHFHSGGRGGNGGGRI